MMAHWSYDEQQQPGKLSVTGALTVAEVGALRTLLLEALGESPRVQVDLGQVVEIDVAGVQLLCAAHRLAASSGRLLEITAAGECVRQLVRGAGFTHAAVCDGKRKNACLWAQLA